MTAVSIPGSEELEVLSPSCIEIVQADTTPINLQFKLRPSARSLITHNRMNPVPHQAGDGYEQGYLRPSSKMPYVSALLYASSNVYNLVASGLLKWLHQSSPCFG
ncbi:hypothetical protein AVEN_225063-1 [Araneus ventricosus]|uniref:Uncharacterized protein n=1 Tax=Araneus ventricosus TaxID=182803 RepID=A0A4Y2JC82_ARAVE|nr:hypothetical protein AVEN_225063-1 [Araneus ventricosus]